MKLRPRGPPSPARAQELQCIPLPTGEVLKTPIPGRAFPGALRSIGRPCSSQADSRAPPGAQTANRQLAAGQARLPSSRSGAEAQAAPCAVAATRAHAAQSGAASRSGRPWPPGRRPGARGARAGAPAARGPAGGAPGHPACPPPHPAPAPARQPRVPAGPAGPAPLAAVALSPRRRTCSALPPSVLPGPRALPPPAVGRAPHQR